MAEIKFEIIRELGIISYGSKGWAKEVNIVKWNDRKPKIDIRDWDETHERMGKGITLSKEEAMELKNILNKIDWDELEI